MDWLADAPRHIHAVTITHNDLDHAGSLPSLVKMSGISISTVYMLLDRNKKSEHFKKLWRPVREEERKNRFSVRELTSDSTIWQNGDTCIKVIYPNFVENIDANNPNETSGVICLFYKNEIKIIWSGDAPMRVVAEKCSKTSPFLLNGPHHGGAIDKGEPEFKNWVNAFLPQRVFVSVGTGNSYDHPSANYLKLQAVRGCHITCTQLTNLCDGKHVKDRKPVLQTAALLGLRASRRGVPCRGCFRLTVTGGSILSDPYDAEHLKGVKSLRRPKCLSHG